MIGNGVGSNLYLFRTEEISGRTSSLSRESGNLNQKIDSSIQKYDYRRVGSTNNRSSKFDPTRARSAGPLTHKPYLRSAVDSCIQKEAQGRSLVPTLKAI